MANIDRAQRLSCLVADATTDAAACAEGSHARTIDGLWLDFVMGGADATSAGMGGRHNRGVVMSAPHTQPRLTDGFRGGHHNPAVVASAHPRTTWHPPPITKSRPYPSHHNRPWFRVGLCGFPDPRRLIGGPRISSPQRPTRAQPTASGAPEESPPGTPQGQSARAASTGMAHPSTAERRPPSLSRPQVR